MRSLPAAALVALLCLAAQRAPAASPTAPLQGGPPTGTFYTQEFAAWVAAGKFDPFAYWTHAPLGVTFGPAGELVLQSSGFAGDELVCRFTASGEPPELKLRATCKGEKEPRSFRFRWRSADEAESDLLASAELPHPILVRAPKTFELLRQEYEAAFAGRQLALLSGSYGRDAAELVLRADGKALLGKREVAIELLECWDLGGPAPVRTACLLLAPSRGTGTAGEWVVRRRGEAPMLVEGAINRRELYPEGLPFEPLAGGRVLPRRASP